jgi:hypothetical protein
MVIPLYVLYFRLDLIDTRLGLTLLHGALNVSLVAFLLRGFFADIPSELEDAARVDGAGGLLLLEGYAPKQLEAPVQQGTHWETPVATPPAIARTGLDEKSLIKRPRPLRLEMDARKYT